MGWNEWIMTNKFCLHIPNEENFEAYIEVHFDDATPERARLEYVWVDESRRRGGIARLLLDQAEQAARKRGVHFLHSDPVPIQRNGNSFAVFEINFATKKTETGGNRPLTLDEKHALSKALREQTEKWHGEVGFSTILPNDSPHLHLGRWVKRLQD